MPLWMGWGITALILLWVLSEAARRVAPWRPYSRVKLGLYSAACFAIMAAGGTGRIPGWMENAATLALVVGYVLTGSGGGGGPRRRCKRQVWTQTKEWLARGIPARRPEGVLR